MRTRVLLASVPARRGPTHSVLSSQCSPKLGSPKLRGTYWSEQNTVDRACTPATLTLPLSFPCLWSVCLLACWSRKPQAVWGIHRVTRVYGSMGKHDRVVAQEMESQAQSTSTISEPAGHPGGCGSAINKSPR